MEAFDLMCIASWVCRTLPEGNDFLSARDVAQSSSPHCAKGVAWGRCEGCRSQLCSASCTQDPAAECTIPLHVCLGELRIWTLPVQPAQFLWGKIGCVGVSNLKNWDIKKLLNFWPLWSSVSQSGFPLCVHTLQGESTATFN